MPWDRQPDWVYMRCPVCGDDALVPPAMPDALAEMRARLDEWATQEPDEDGTLPDQYGSGLPDQSS